MIEDSPARRRLFGGSLIAMWVVNLATVALLAFVLLVFLPKMAVAFADFGVKLPGVTVLVLRASQAPTLICSRARSGL